MNKATSLYLDVVRLFAALIVLASHLASQELSGGRFWFTKMFDQMAVIAFFILSGYVIGYVVLNKENTFLNYAISRFARIYSVVIPALLLTFAFDFVGLKINPELYINGPWAFNNETGEQNYTLALFMLHNVWSINQNPGINGPFWSLSFEWFYYFIFGVIWFFKGGKRFLGFGLLALLSGPEILVLFTLWYSGFYAYKRGVKKPVLQSFRNAAISLIALLMSFVSAYHLHDNTFLIPFVLRDAILSDFACGLFFAIHIYFSPALAQKIYFLLIKFEKTIRYFAAASFALYLFHRPIIQLVAALSPVSLTEVSYYISQWVIVFLIVLPLSKLCDDFKCVIKKRTNDIVTKFKEFK